MPALLQHCLVSHSSISSQLPWQYSGQHHLDLLSCSSSIYAGTSFFMIHLHSTVGTQLSHLISARCAIVTSRRCCGHCGWKSAGQSYCAPGSLLMLDMQMPLEPASVSRCDHCYLIAIQDCRISSWRTALAIEDPFA